MIRVVRNGQLPQETPAVTTSKPPAWPSDLAVACRGVLQHLQLWQPGQPVGPAERWLSTEWQSRAAALLASGWPKTRNPELLSLCSPSLTVRRCWACRQTRVCPFCYSRYLLLPAWQALQWGWDFCQGPVEVCELELAQRFDLRRRSLRQSLEDADQLLCDVSPGPACRGSLSLTRYLPLDEATLGVLFNGVVLLPPRATPGWEGVPTEAKPKFYSSLTRRELGPLLANACRYPVSLLRGDVDLLVEILSAIRHRHLLRTTGVLRNATWRAAKVSATPLEAVHATT